MGHDCTPGTALSEATERPGICAIVGAGQGLGAALAERFARGGFDIALLSRSETSAEAARKAALTARPTTQVWHQSADATEPASLERALLALSADAGPIDVLIYNVRGAFTACEPLDMSYGMLEDTFRLEVSGAFAAAKVVLPGMRTRGHGTIFFSSATAAFRGSATHPVYAIGKFGLRALSQSLTKAYAKDGVHIVHMRLDCDLDVPIMHGIYGATRDQAGLADPKDVAETYWLTYQQPKGAWSNEVEIRPHTETWTY